MKAPALFEFETQAVRVVSDDAGEAWFVASDIATVLEYRTASDMTRHLDDDEKGTRNVRTLGGEQEMTIINEAGLYSAILKSRKLLGRLTARALDCGLPLNGSNVG